MLESLAKIYYTDVHRHKRAYETRYNSSSSIHLEVKIRQYNHEKEYPAFVWYNQDLALSVERVYSCFVDFMSILPKLSLSMHNQFALASIVEEVQSTSEIEGIHSTHRELRGILEGLSDNRHFSSIVKKYDMLSSGEYPEIKTNEDVREFYDEFVHVDVISNNPANRLDGKLFRKDGVDVKSKSGKTIHKGLEPESKIIESLTEALSFLNSREYPALIRIAVFHYLFVYIHPFYDGNGRTARFISSSYIAQHLHSLVGLRLSITLKKKKSKYYALLKEADSEINCGDLTPFVNGFLGFIADTLQDMNRKLKRKIKQLGRIKQRLSESFKDEEKNVIAWDIIQNSVFYGRGSSMDDLMQSTGKTRNTIKSRLSKMPVREITRGRKKYYKFNWSALRRIAF